MLGLRQVGSWSKQFLEYWTTSEIEQPTWEELAVAAGNAAAVIHKLGLYRISVQQQWPHDPDTASTVSLITEVLRALGDDHGGVGPWKTLEFWLLKRDRLYYDRDIFATPKEKEAMVEVCERWQNLDWLPQPFFCRLVNSQIVTEAHVQEMKGCLHEFLRKRRTGELY